MRDSIAGWLAGIILLTGTMAHAAGITPIVLRPLQHEPEQFNWHPAFEPGVPTFDSVNRGWIRSRTTERDVVDMWAQTETDDAWTSFSITGAVRAKYPNYLRSNSAGGFLPTRIVFDEQDHAYTLLSIRNGSKDLNLLLYSKDQCRTWQIYELAAGAFTIEYFTGHNEIIGPPAIALHRKTADHPATYASVNTLTVLLPTKTASGLNLGTPIEVTKASLGWSQHSGGASFAATKGDKTHIVWCEIADAPTTGVPMFTATIDRKTRTLGEKVLLAHGAPINDVHNIPGIALDSRGTLHVITGAHGANFWHLMSKAPESTTSGWTTPAPTLTKGWIDKTTKQESGRQTYLSLLVGPDDTLHIAFRQWRQGVDPWHPGNYFGALSYQRRPRDGAWSEAMPLVVPPVLGYSVWYHQMAIDRRGRLFLSYSYWGDVTKWPPPYKGLTAIHTFRGLITSTDGGDSWNLVDSLIPAAGQTSAKLWQ